jgi:hypothetical protein
MADAKACDAFSVGVVKFDRDGHGTRLLGWIIFHV